MGLYDRDYYRRDPPSAAYLGAESGRVSLAIILGTLAVYLLQVLSAGGEPQGLGWLTWLFSVQPERIYHRHEYWRLITGIFLHDPHHWMHVVWNMLFLWFFGPDIERRYGSGKFAVLYVCAGLTGNVLWSAHALLTGAGHTMQVGASGAVTGVVILLAILDPRRIILLMFVLPIPLWLFAVIYVVGNVVYFLHGHRDVAVLAHLGGAGFAVAYWWLGGRLTKLPARMGDKLLSCWRRLRRPRLRIFRPDEHLLVQSRSPALDEEVDAILDKVARHGLDSLTNQEREVLLRASEQLRRRRYR